MPFFLVSVEFPGGTNHSLHHPEKGLDSRVPWGTRHQNERNLVPNGRPTVFNSLTHVIAMNEFRSWLTLEMVWVSKFLDATTNDTLYIYIPNYVTCHLRMYMRWLDMIWCGWVLCDWNWLDVYRLSGALKENMNNYPNTLFLPVHSLIRISIHVNHSAGQ